MQDLVNEIKKQDPTFEYNDEDVAMRVFEWYHGKNPHGFDMDFIENELNTKGYCVIENVLNSDEINTAKQQLYEWQKTIPNHDKFHNDMDPHGIYKFHNAGHTQHAWELRLNEKVQSIYEYMWKTKELVVSFDGACYIPKSCRKRDNIWTHTDQAPSNPHRCYQGFVALTSNEERTLVVYEGSHHYHSEYFQEHGCKDEKSNWQRINYDVLESMAESKRILKVPAGSLVLWDSRTFHQNQYGKPDSEERFVQYICYLPKNDFRNSTCIQNKRKKYFDEMRTTSHWPYPIKVNGLQPQTYGDKSRVIDYSALKRPKLDHLYDKIARVI